MPCDLGHDTLFPAYYLVIDGVQMRHVVHLSKLTRVRLSSQTDSKYVAAYFAILVLPRSSSSAMQFYCVCPRNANYDDFPQILIYKHGR